MYSVLALQYSTVQYHGREFYSTIYAYMYPWPYDATRRAAVGAGVSTGRDASNATATFRVIRFYNKIGLCARGTQHTFALIPVGDRTVQ